MVQPANKMKAFQPSIFGQLKVAAAERMANGGDVVDLSLGSPDVPPAKIVRETLAESSLLANNYGYTLGGLDRFHEAVVRYYGRRSQVVLDPQSEVLLTMGSQEGLIHLPLAFCNPGDIVLTTDPAYVAYDQGIHVAGAEPYYMPLTADNDFLPNLAAIPEDVARRAKLLLLNLPGNPVPAMPTLTYFNEVVQFAKKYDILVVHDAAYSEYYFSGDKPLSFLEADGAKDVGLEINSLSKSFSLAGARIAYFVGNKTAIGILRTLKSNLDYGVFAPIQEAAITALDHAEEITDELREIFARRHQIVMGGLRAISWEAVPSDGGMFVWAKYPYHIPARVFAFQLINDAGVVTVPGTEFGSQGEGYVRIALVQDEDRLRDAMAMLAEFHQHMA